MLFLTLNDKCYVKNHMLIFMLFRDLMVCIQQDVLLNGIMVYQPLAMWVKPEIS